MDEEKESENKGLEKESEKNEESAANIDNKEIVNEEKTNEQAPQNNDLIGDKSADKSEQQQESEKEEHNNEPEKPDNEETPEEKVEPVKEVIPPTIPKKNKEGSFKPIIFVMIASLGIAMFWDSIPFIKDSVHAVLDPSAGGLLNWNVTIGMLLIVLAISLLTTVIQKYATDQKALRELKKEQKILQEEMKKYKDNPAKVAELSKKQFAFIPKTFKLTSRAIMFTGIPFILFFRWFNDFFAQEAFVDFTFFGFLSWFWFYLIATMVFSTVLRKVFKVV